MSFIIALTNAIAKITGWLLQKIIFRLKIFYEDKSVQSRKIKGAAILMSNHTQLFDYAAFIFVFFWRTLRYQMAEVLFKKRGLGLLLKCLGGIKVDRDAHDFSFMVKSEELLKKGKVVGVFPESRLPKEGEDDLLEFKPSITKLALSSGAPIIPMYTEGRYLKSGRSNIIIGKPVFVRDMYDEGLTERENIEIITVKLRDKVKELRDILNEKKQRKGATKGRKEKEE